MSLPSRYPSPVRVHAAGVTCVRGGRTVFQDLGFTLDPGEMLALTGPNGAGKSSLLRIVAGLLEPEGGTIEIRSGQESQEPGPRRHYLGHLDGLKAPLSLAENLQFWASVCGTASPPGTAIINACAEVGLAQAADFPAGILSAGQRRRAGLARLLISPQPLWLLDEPTSALDVDGEALLGALLRRHLDAGGSVLAATHGPLPIAPTGRLQFREPA